MLAVEIMRSFLPAHHLWYVKAVGLTNWQQHLSCTRFTFWKLKGKRGRKISRESGREGRRARWRSETGERVCLSDPHRGNSDMSYILIQTHSWMIDSANGISVEIDLKGHKTPLCAALQRSSLWVSVEVKLRSGSLTHPVKYYLSSYHTSRPLLLWNREENLKICLSTSIHYSHSVLDKRSLHLHLIK